MKRVAVLFSFLAWLVPGLAAAELLEMRLTIFGMD